MQKSKDSTKSIVIRCEGAATQPLDKLVVLQGGLKKLTKKNLDRLKARIVDAGFCAPFFIWDHDGELMILDGTQRRAALIALEADGWTVPPLPVVYIYADTEQKAREILLSISSQYGEWVDEELTAWLEAIDDDIKKTLRLTEEEVNLIPIPSVDFKNEEDTRGSRSANVSKSKMVVSIGKMSELIEYGKVERCCLKISAKFDTLEAFCEWLINTL